MSALPSSSEIDLLGNSKSIIYLYPEVSDRALDFRVPKQQLDCLQVTGPPVD